MDVKVPKRPNKPPRARAPGAGPQWKLEDAKARFSEVVRLARTEGPQRVSVRGKDAVVVISAETMSRLSPADPDRSSIVAFLESLSLDELDLSRAPDHGRDIDL
jgi:prevent-host-death family protein